MKTRIRVSKIAVTFIVSLLMSLLVAASIYAAPANPFPQEMQQADGSIVILTGGGDESFGWLECPFGFIVMWDNDTRNFTYAQIVNGQLVPNSANVVGQSNMGFAPLSAAGRLTVDDILPLWNAAERVEPHFDYPSFVQRHSLFNQMQVDEEGNVSFGPGDRPGEIVTVRASREIQEIFPVIIEFTEPTVVGGREYFNRFRDSRFTEIYGRPIFQYIYEDLPGIAPGTTATQYWGRKFFDASNPRGSVVHYFNEQAFGVLDPEDPYDQFFIPAPEIQTMFPDGVDRFTGVRTLTFAGTGFNLNNVPYEVYLDREWNIFRVTLHIEHPSLISNTANTQRLMSSALDIIMYDDNGFDRNPSAQNWTRTGTGGHSPTNGIPPQVHLYGIIAGHDASSNNGFGLGQTWAHASSTVGLTNAFGNVGNTTANPVNRKRWVSRAYAHNGEIFNGNPLTIGANQLPFATMSIGVMAHEFGHTLGVGDTYDTTNANSLSLRPYSLMAHGSWGTVIDEVPGSMPTRLDPLHMLEMGMLRSDQLIIVESIENFDEVLHPFYLSDSFYHDKRLDTPVGSYIPGGTAFLPGNNVPNPDFNVLMIWAPESRATFHEEFAAIPGPIAGGQGTTRARLVPTEFFLLEFRLPMGYDRGMTRYGIGVNSVPHPDDPRGFHHTARVDSRAMQPMWPGAPALTPHNSGAIIDGGVLMFHYDRTASPASFNPQNANMHHKRASLILADGSDLLLHFNNFSWNSSYGAHYASHDYFVNQDHFFSNSLTRSVIAAMAHSPVQLQQGINAPIIRGTGTSLAYQAYMESNLYAAGVRLNRLFNGFSLNVGADPSNVATWQYGTFGRGPETGYYKLEVPTPMPGTVNPASNVLIFSPSERNTFPTAHLFDRTWPGTGTANINLSRFARTGNIPSGVDLEFHNTRLEAIELVNGRTQGMRITNRVWDVDIELFMNGQPYNAHNMEFVLRLAQFNPQTTNLLEDLPPIRNHPDSVSIVGNVVTIGVTNGEWMIFELLSDGSEVFTGYTVIVYEGLHTPVQFNFMNLPYDLVDITVYNNSLPLVYAIGGNPALGTIDFSNFYIQIEFDDDGDEIFHVVNYKDFGLWGITANFSHGDILTIDDHNADFEVSFRNLDFTLGQFIVTDGDQAVLTINFNGAHGTVMHGATPVAPGDTISVAPNTAVTLAVTLNANSTSTGWTNALGARTNRAATGLTFNIALPAGSVLTGNVHIEMAPLHTVTYNGNGHTGGTVPGDVLVQDSFYLDAPRSFNTSGNTGGGALVRAGYLFTGWNTASDGTGDAFNAGQAIVGLDRNITLYAQWSANPVTITYLGNGNTGGTMAPTVMIDGGNHIVRPNGFTRTGGWIFVGWNTEADGSGAWWHVNNVIENVTAEMRLYAQWSQGRTAQITQPQSLELNTGGPLRSGIGGNVSFTVETVAFPIHLTELWTVNLYGHPSGVSILTNFMINTGTANDGQGILTLNVGANVPPGTYPIYLEIHRNRNGSPDGNIIFSPPLRTPVFELVVLPYDEDYDGRFAISYLPNGGSGTPMINFYDVGAFHHVRTFEQTGLVAPGGLYFVGWNTLPTGLGVSFEPGQAIPAPLGGLTLHAMWQAASVTSINVVPNPSKIVQGEALQFIANVEVISNAPTSVTWAVTGHAGASIDSNGLLTVASTVPVDTVLTVRATSTHSFLVSGSTSVTVIATGSDAVTGVTVTPAIASVARDATQQFAANVTTVGTANNLVAWSVAGHSGASIDADGLLNVGPDVPVGTTLTVTVTSTFDTDMFATAIVTVDAADTAGLQAAITQAEALIQSNYTRPSWAMMQNALFNARAVLANINASEEDVNNVTVALLAAIDDLVALQAAPNTEALDALIIVAQGIYTDGQPNNVSRALWAMFRIAIVDAQTVQTNAANLTQTQVNDAVDALQASIDSLGL